MKERPGCVRALFLWENSSTIHNKKGPLILYKQGDTIAHAHHGIGVIKSIQEKEILGSKAIFATLYFKREELKMTVPMGQLERLVRAVMDETKANEVLAYLEAWNDSLSSSWKMRKKNNQERLTSGNPMELCIVAKGLIRLNREKGSLATSDREQLQRSLEILAEELSAALGGEMEPMKERLEQVCHKTCEAA